MADRAYGGVVIGPNHQPRKRIWLLRAAMTGLLASAFVAALLVAAQPGRTETGAAGASSGSRSAPALQTGALGAGFGFQYASTGGTPSPPTTPAASVLYRPIGCVRRGPAVAYRSGPQQKVVALSFDDGPATDTPAFVRMLESQHAHATFFMIGRQITDRYRSTLRRELRDGDALGDHTYTHPDLDLLSATEVRRQLSRTIAAIRGLTGYTPCVLRPPYGDYDQPVINAAKSLGLATVLWNVDPSDYTLPGVSAIQQRVLAQVRPGSIILSHDGGGPRGQTLAAYPYVIRTLKSRGFRFETIPQLLGFKTVYRRCTKDCDGVGVPWPLPPGSIIQK